MKKVLLLIIILICSIVMIGLDLKMMTDFEKNNSDLKSQVAQLEQQVTELSEKNENNSTDSKSEKRNSADEEETSDEFSRDTRVSFNPNKMKVYAENAEYSSEEIQEQASKLEEYGINIKIENGEAYVSTDDSKDWYKDLFEDIDEIEDKKIEGFETKIDEVKVMIYGQDLARPIILFMMEDGSVEYVKSETMLKDEKYESEGKIEDLENIVDIAYASVTEDNASGYITTVAIDQDGYAYDLTELIDL